MSTMTNKMSEAGSGHAATAEKHGHSPKKGDRFRCKECGMEVLVTVDCPCDEGEDHAHFHCCGQVMAKV